MSMRLCKLKIAILKFAPAIKSAAPKTKSHALPCLDAAARHASCSIQGVCKVRTTLNPQPGTQNSEPDTLNHTP
jgi:hypothetical protein